MSVVRVMVTERVGYRVEGRVLVVWSAVSNLTPMNDANHWLYGGQASRQRMMPVRGLQNTMFFLSPVHNGQAVKNYNGYTQDRQWLYGSSTIILASMNYDCQWLYGS